ncbi:MAG: hypothetical protein E7468_05230 [Ruminococcaceae bacterium]|nr:hypothetical protein [Oscillospiraceae bacterium]
MPMDEVIRAIEQTDAENMQDLLQATMKRYRELYPEWKIAFLSAKADAPDEVNKAILELIHIADSLVS